MRTGPTGTPLIATYHSSVTLSSTGLLGCGPTGTVCGPSCTVRWNAPARPPRFCVCGATPAAGARGFAAERLVARPLLAAMGRGTLSPPPVGDDVDTLVSVTAARTSIWWPHLRHFMRTVLPATFSSAIWYFALQLSQRNFKGLQARITTFQPSRNPLQTLAEVRRFEPAQRSFER